MSVNGKLKNVRTVSDPTVSSDLVFYCRLENIIQYLVSLSL
jgi:hypothetical protein